MEVCYQLPVLPLDRPVPKHVLSRRGAISFSSSSSLFGGPDPRKLSQRRGGISYDSSDQTALYIRMLDVRIRSRVGFEPELRCSHPYLLVDFRLLHYRPGCAGPFSARGVRRLVSFQRYRHPSRSACRQPNQSQLCVLDQDYIGQAKCMLGKAGSWSFDIFLFDRLTNGNSLVTLTAHLFNHYGLIKLFQLDMVKLHRFLVMIQEDYHSQNPYHNAVHAADVTQAMYCYLQEPKLVSSLTSFDILLGLLAAATHDLDHPGVNQPFLVKTQHYLAALYQNSSVLENHHWRSAVGLLRQSGLLDHLPAEDRQSLERRLGSLILATDINRQNEYLSQFRSHLDRDDLNLENSAHRHLILQMALKCADICNPCRPWELSKQWSEKVTQEFFQQGTAFTHLFCAPHPYANKYIPEQLCGDMILANKMTTCTYCLTGDVEKKHNLEVSPFCDSQSNTIADIQTGFMSYVVEPLFSEWARFSDTQLSRAMLHHLDLNKAHWTDEMDPKTNPQGNQGS